MVPSAKDPVLRAIFSQITAEVRKTGRVLADDDGSFYVSGLFTWKGCQKKFLDAYYAICVRKQITPIPPNSKIESALKVPYASDDTINLLYNCVFERIRQFHDRLLEPFSKYPSKPSLSDIQKMRGSVMDDKDMYGFLNMADIICQELNRYVKQLDSLVTCYDKRVKAFADALNGAKAESSIITQANDSKRQILNILNPYIDKLKKLGVISKTWQYSFRKLPLTEDKSRYLIVSTMNPSAPTYWDNDDLPLKSKLEEEKRKKAIAEKEKAKRLKKEKRKEKRKDNIGRFFRSIKWGIRDFFESLGYGIRKAWRGYNDLIENIGDFFYYDRNRNTRFLIKALGWIVVSAAVLLIIYTWIDKSFWSALGVGFLCFMAFGLYTYVEGLVYFVAKLAFDIPQYILRIIFYRGWSFLLFLVLLAGALLLWHFYPYLNQPLNFR